jgi:hypothetical protein
MAASRKHNVGLDTIVSLLDEDENEDSFTTEDTL